MLLKGLVPNATIKALRTQGRVIVALTIRSMQEEIGESRLGFGAMFVQPLILMAVYLTAHVFIKSLSPPDMPAALFVVLGIVPWFTFLNTMKSVTKSPKAAKNLLGLTRVTILDVIVSQCLMEFCTGSVLFFVVASFALVFSGGGPPANPGGVALAYFSAWLMGCGFGLVLLAAERTIPGVDKISMLINRVGLLTSGVFFTASQLPPSSLVYFSWNPMLHVIEFSRSCWFSIYHSPIANAGFVAECIIGLLLFGLMFERSIRRVSA